MVNQANDQKLNIDIHQLCSGMQIPPFNIVINETMYKKYNRLINEINPLHFNKDYAKKLGFKNIVVAGNFTFTFISKWIIDWIGDTRPLKEITVKFERPVYINDELIHKGIIKDIKEISGKKVIECEYNVEKTNGEIISEGIIKLSF